MMIQALLNMLTVRATKTDSTVQRINHAPQFEAMEQRQLLSATLVGDTLTIDGTNQSDHIAISAGGANGEVVVDSAPDVDSGTVFTGVNVIIINGLNGNDKIIVGDNIVDTVGSVIGVTIDAGAGNDNVTTSDGNDIISLGQGNDRLNDSGGDNTVDATGGHNKITTGNGIDNITTGNGHDKIKSGGGDDVVDAGGGNNKVHAGSGNDDITTGNGKDKIWAVAGNNIIDAGHGKNMIKTGGGDDIIIGGDERNHIKDSGGNNTITTGNGKDKITTGDGDDVIDSGTGKDKVDSGDGTDTVDNDVHHKAKDVTFVADNAQIEGTVKKVGNELVYVFTADANGTVDLTLTPDAGQELTVHLEDDTDADLLTITGGTLAGQINVTAGTTYYIEVNADAKGDFLIDLLFTLVP